jgi:hypothetical protein
MTEHEQLVWAAGFFDGEGSVGIAKQERLGGKRRNWKTAVSYVLGVAICQKDPRPLELVHQMFGGHFYPYQVKGVTYWRWHTWGGIALRFMQAIRPYVVLKGERLDIGIEFQTKLTKWYAEYGKIGYPPEVDEQRESMFQRLRLLNKRNRAEGSPEHRKPGVKKGSANNFANRWAEKGEEQAKA